jgi:quercetin dioxygenase-like cupin family protein
VTAAPVVRAVVLDVTLPSAKATARVQARRITMAPGVAGGAHVHNGPVFGHIVSGSVVYQISGESPVVLRAGDVFHEPEGVVIARFDALDEGVTFMGYFLVGLDEEPELTAV